MTSLLRLRPMSTADLDAVHRLEVSSSPDPWSRQLLADELVEPADGQLSDRIWTVAVDHATSAVAGFGGLLITADEAHVMNLVVEAEYRRTGVASILLAALLEAALDRGAIDATLEVRASNAAARRLYQRFGFVESGQRRGYYQNGEDATIMWCRKLYRPAHQKRWRALTQGSTA